MATPLTDSLKNENQIDYTDPKYINSFEKLKQMLINYPILKYPNFKEKFTLTTDASNKAIGAILSQKGHPISYASRTFNVHERNYSTIEKELLAIVWATKYFRPYLYGIKFEIKTDHRPLVWLQSLKDPDSKTLRWRIKLNEYNFNISYVKGKENQVADFLSRINTDQNEINYQNKIPSDIATIHSGKEELNDHIHIREGIVNTCKYQIILVKENQKELKTVHKNRHIYIDEIDLNSENLTTEILKRNLPEKGKIGIYSELPYSIYNKLQILIVKLFSNNLKLHFIKYSKRAIHLLDQEQTLKVIFDNAFDVISITQFLKSRDIEYHTTAPGSHTGTADINRCHNTLTERIRTIQEIDKQKDLDFVILEAVESYNNTVHSTTSYTPFEIQFGKINKNKLTERMQNRKNIWISKINQKREQKPDIENKQVYVKKTFRRKNEPLFQRREIEKDSNQNIIQKKNNKKINLDRIKRQPKYYKNKETNAKELIKKDPIKYTIEKYGISIYENDLKTLDNQNWLNDNIINFYLNLITENNNKMITIIFIMLLSMVTSEPQYIKNEKIKSNSGIILIPKNEPATLIKDWYRIYHTINLKSYVKAINNIQNTKINNSFIKHTINLIKSELTLINPKINVKTSQIITNNKTLEQQKKEEFEHWNECTFLKYNETLDKMSKCLEVKNSFPDYKHLHSVNMTTLELYVQYCNDNPKNEECIPLFNNASEHSNFFNCMKKDTVNNCHTHHVIHKRGLFNFIGTGYNWLFGLQVSTEFVKKLNEFQKLINEELIEIKITQALSHIQDELEKIIDNINSAKIGIMTRSLLTKDKINTQNISLNQLKLTTLVVLQKENKLTFVISIPNIIEYPQFFVRKIVNQNFEYLNITNSIAIKTSDNKYCKLEKYIKNLCKPINCKSCKVRDENFSYIEEIENEKILVVNAEKLNCVQKCKQTNVITLQGNYVITFVNCEVTINNNAYVNKVINHIDNLVTSPIINISDIQFEFNFTEIKMKTFQNNEEIRELHYINKKTWISTSTILLIISIILALILFTYCKLKNKTIKIKNVIPTVNKIRENQAKFNKEDESVSFEDKVKSKEGEVTCPVTCVTPSYTNTTCP
ncbi:uncharacterized protein LOC119653954 [Hermetia illucens]|uniref:uncharacterized protein LOC119653954 n=1 Tax=Hermetia illucens TaxID=343691 RepID=UPI0018CC2D74|nr:uncharacterized protein LOC119653954 [Hermetia illucens]